MTYAPIALDVHPPFAAQVCCATSMTPALATPATRAPTATPTLSTAKPSARVLRGTWGQPATRTWTSAHWVSAGAELVRVAEEQLGKASVRPGSCPMSCACVLQEPTLVSTRGNASTPRGPSSASVCRATRALAARSTSTSASPTPARTMPPAWTRLGSSSASACPVGGQPCGPLPRGWVWVTGGLRVPLSFSSVSVWVRSHGRLVCLGTSTEKKEPGKDCTVSCSGRGTGGESRAPSALLWTRPLAELAGLDQAKGREIRGRQPWSSLCIRSYYL